MNQSLPQTLEALSPQQRLLAAMLPHVPFEGWSMAALEQGATSLAMSPTERLQTFPNGVDDALDCFMHTIDHKMAQSYAALTPQPAKIHEKIHAVAMCRFHASLPHREAMRKALAYYAVPLRVDKGLKRLYQTVDTMWRAVGDTPTDFSFYTKRAILAAIYSATLLFWLDDTSANLQETSDFLGRRLRDHFRMRQMKEKFLRACSKLAP